jgi:catechol 2,3-dioxygenase-like lactoylglutathione lyase family enzyme
VVEIGACWDTSASTCRTWSRPSATTTACCPSWGFEEFIDGDDQFAYRPAGGRPGTYLFFYPAAEPDYSRDRPGLQHLAFMVKTRSAVRAVHELVTELGSQVVHQPQEFPQYPPPYFAMFWLDPFGFMLEAVCHYDRD